MKENCDYTAIVLGAGHNGLTAAAYLAKAGCKVLVLERRPFVGGACATEELFPGFRVSSCAYICHLLQEKVIEDLDLRRHGFDVHRLEPDKFCPFPDGRALLSWEQPQRSVEAIAEFSRHDAQAYPRWIEFWRRAAGIIYPYFLTRPPTLAELFQRTAGGPDEQVLETLLTASMRQLVEHFFESAHVRASFIQAQDAGDPAAVGSAFCYAHIKCDLFSNPASVGIVKGGMGTISDSIRKSAELFGAELRTGVEVERIVVEDGRARGVRLADGTTLTAQVVLSNADPKRTFLQLIDAEQLDTAFRSRVERLSTRTAYLKFHAALKELPDFSRFLGPGGDPRALANIKICPSIDYYQRAWDQARAGRPAEEPVMEVQIPSVYDRSLVDGDGHVMSVWALYAPPRPADADWESLREEVGRRLIQTLAAYAPNLPEAIVHWSLFTPADLQQRVALTDGNIRHLDIIPSQFLSRRPMVGWSDYRSPIENLYLCGAGTHPGGEVTAAPGHNAAHEVLRRMT